MNPTFLYVGAIYAAAVALARRARVDISWRLAAFFYLLVLIFLFRPMTQEYVNVPVDYLQTLPPWSHTVKQPRAANPELNDLTLQIIPWAHQVREAWRSLQWPVWNPYSGSGYPLLGNSQSSAFSPLRILALPLPLGYAMTSEAAMKLLIALTFMYLFCRKRGYGELPSAIGAVGFGFCTFINTWLHFPIVSVTMFLPAVLYQIDLLLERWTYPRFCFAVAIWAAMLFGGHPESCTHIFFMALLYLGWILLVERPMRARKAMRFVVLLGVAMILAAIIAAPLLATFAEGVTKSFRFADLKVHPNLVAPFSDLPSALLLLSPNFFGHVPLENSWGPTKAESITGFAGVFGLAAWFTLLLHVLIKRRWRERETFWVIATPLILGIILDWPIVSILFHKIFFLALNARLRMLLCFVSAIMAAAVSDLLLRERMRVLYAGIGSVGAALLWAYYGTQFPDSVKQHSALVAITPSLVVLGIALLLPIAGRFRPIVLMFVGAAMIAEIWIAEYGWNPVLPASMMYPDTPLIAKLRQLIATHAPSRFVGTGPVFFPNSSAVYGLEDIRTHDPMANGRYIGELRVLGGYDVDSYFAMWKNFDTRLLDYLNVRYVVAEPKATVTDTQRYRVVYSGKDGTIFENRDVLPRFFPAWAVLLEFKGDLFNRRLVHFDTFSWAVLLKRLPVESDKERQDLLAPRPNNAPRTKLSLTSWSATDYRMHISAPRWTVIVSSIPYWPGWEASTATRSLEVLQVDGPFLGFTIPPGEHDVRVHFVPVTFYLGLAASLITIAAMCVWPLFQRQRSRSRSTAESE
jgi:hypothetical protein